VRNLGEDGKLAGPGIVVDAMTGTEESMALTGDILRLALAEYKEFGFEALGIRFGFNLPLDAMLHPDLIDIIESIRKEAGMMTKSIAFELTERHPVHDIARVSAVLSVMRDAGYSVVLDDITPGMVNLDKLLQTRITGVKLDYTMTNSRKPQDIAFIRRIVAFAAAAKKNVIAEGVETPETLAHLTGLGIDLVQGFLFSQPLQAAALKPFVMQFHQS
jgi:EAL domain-containing protein (putative c-di-GMP-specific phosphodiesterase class I)